MSQRAGNSCGAQRKYLTLAILELRKSRCNKERQSARERLENVDSRMAEIERQQAVLARDAAAATDSTSPSELPATREHALPNQQGFRLTY
ncbi:MAG: hypothetical protein ACOC7K_00775 [bacterium]